MTHEQKEQAINVYVATLTSQPRWIIELKKRCKIWRRTSSGGN